MTIAARMRRFGADRGGVSIVEFAMILPLLLVLFLGGFVIAKTIAISRKITITTRALADLTSQYKSVADSDLATVMNASTQILAPFDPMPLNIRLTEIQLDSTALFATVVFSKVAGSTFAPYVVGAKTFSAGFNVPLTPNTTYIIAETSYKYTVATSSQFDPPVTLGDRIYMLPRLVASIPYTGS